MVEQETFGARYVAATTARERLQLEQDERRRSPFTDVDQAIKQLIATALAGDRVASVSRSRNNDRLIPALDLGEHADAFAHHFGAEAHEQRGGWHLPADECLIDLGTIHMTHWITTTPRVALTMAESDSARVLLRDDPWAVALWSLEPVFDQLNLPLKLRSGYWLGARTEAQQLKTWHEIDPLYAALDLDPQPVAAFRLDTGWDDLDTDTILSRRRSLTNSWQRAIETAADRFRIHRTGGLVERYYSKARKGVALRRSVLNRNLERTLTLYFGGDWLAFLNYIGEPPHPKEELVSGLPETRLIATDPARTSAVAAEHGLSADEVDRILAALWQHPDSSSTIERRTAVMRDYWREFDRLHTEQRSGMPSLRGLVTDLPWYRYPESVDQSSPSDLSQRLLPDLDARIAELWGTTMLARWPDRLLTEPAHHLRMCEAFGTALTFWQILSNAAWELCEGPADEWHGPATSISQLESRTIDERKALRDVGCPVDTQLFRDLEHLETVRGRPAHDDGGPLTISLTVTADGVLQTQRSTDDSSDHVRFEQLRDVISAHRKGWAADHLDRYLRSRWEPPLRASAIDYHLHAANKSRPPSPKQFASKAETVANLWFGGELSSLYTAIGLRGPAVTTRADRRVPPFPDRVSLPLFERLRGEPFKPRPSMKADSHERIVHDGCAYLARMWLQVLHVWEATEVPPPVTTVGRSNFEPLAYLLAEDTDAAWRMYCEAVETIASSQLDGNTTAS